jgi:hypothetical protein
LSLPIEHNIDDEECKKNGTGWLKEWIEWMICEEADRSPLSPQYSQNPFEIEGRQGEYSCEKDGEKHSVWFLGGPVYGGRLDGTYTKWVVLPPNRKWHILGTPFTSYVSHEEYPGLTKEELYLQASKDLQRATITGTLDGQPLKGFRVSIKEPFEVENIPSKNVMSLSNEELERCDHKVTMCAEGHVYWLNPLDPGLHLLRLTAHSPVYEFDVKFQLNVRAASRR